MAETVENLTVRLLQEIRGDVAALRADMSEVKEEITDLRTRVDGNAVILNFIAGTLSDHETRIEALVDAAPELR